MRLKEELLQEIPGFLEQRNGRCVVLTIADELGKRLVECSQNTLKVDGFILPKGTRIVRKLLFEVFHGDLSKNKRKSFVTLPLLNLASLILDGKSRFDNLSTNASSIVVNLAHLLWFNAVKIKRRLDGFVGHSKTNEPPLPVRVGLMVHSKTRKKSLVENLAKEGLRISYKSVEEIESWITKQLCFKYNEDEIICPLTLQYGLFKVAAIDIIDPDPSSTRTNSFFYCTIISIFQYLDLKIPTRSSFKLGESVSSCKNIRLPAITLISCPFHLGKHNIQSLTNLQQTYDQIND